MNTIAKVGIASTLGIIVIPSAVVGSGGSGSTTSKIKNVGSLLKNSGYSKKDSSRLVDFNRNRETQKGGNFALGCHRLIFEGKNVRRLYQYSSAGNNWEENEPPISEYLGDKEKPLLACSTASMMKDSESKDVYEYELAIKRGDIGFLERISVWKNEKKATSQLVLYKKNDDPITKSTHPWINRYGVQRNIDKSEFEVGSPIDSSWTELKDLEKTGENQPRYFSVWISDSLGKGMLENLGIRVKSEQKWFSSIAKATSEKEWYFRFFGRDQKAKTELNTQANANNNKANYTSLIADEVASFKGSWKGVKEFCDAQQITDNSTLTQDEFERLKNYCYTNQKVR